MVASKYFSAWRDLLIHVHKRKESRLTNTGIFKGQTLGVDMSSWFHSDMQLHRDFAFGMGWRFNHYGPERFMDMIQRRHEKLIKLDVKPIYVFPGRANPNRIFRDRELHAIEKMREFYRTSREHRIMSSNEHKKVICTAMHMCHLVHHKMIPFLAQWMQEALDVQKHQIINAPFETVWQLRELERTNVTAATISNDCTLAMIGGQRMLVFCKFTGKKLFYNKFDFERDVERKKYQHDFRGLSDYLPEAMTFFGTDYYQRVFVSAKHSIQKDFPSYIIDHQRMLQQQEQEGIQNDMNIIQDEEEDDEYGDDHSRKRPVRKPTPMHRGFRQAANQLRYGPVIRQRSYGDENADGNYYAIEPLNPLPEGVTWKDAIGFDPISEVLFDMSPVDYGKAMRFEDGHSFCVPILQPSPYPGWEEMTCVMPKPKKKRPSKKEKKLLRELQASTGQVNAVQHLDSFTPEDDGGVDTLRRDKTPNKRNTNDSNSDKDDGSDSSDDDSTDIEDDGSDSDSDSDDSSDGGTASDDDDWNTDAKDDLDIDNQSDKKESDPSGKETSDKEKSSDLNNF